MIDLWSAAGWDQGCYGWDGCRGCEWEHSLMVCQLWWLINHHSWQTIQRIIFKRQFTVCKWESVRYGATIPHRAVHDDIRRWAPGATICQHAPARHPTEEDKLRWPQLLCPWTKCEEQPAVRFAVYRHLAGHLRTNSKHFYLTLICISAFAALANLGCISVIIVIIIISCGYNHRLFIAVTHFVFC